MILEVEKTMKLSVSPERVWRAITEADEIAAWFPESIQWEAKVDAEGWFGWAAHGNFAVRIEAFEPPRYMAWRWAREPGKPLSETDTTLVEWTLYPRQSGGTTLRLKESGFKNEKYSLGNDAGWNAELAELLHYLDEPETPIS